MRRDRAAGWLGGVCAGIARRYGVDVALVRLAFVVATAAGGLRHRPLRARLARDPCRRRAPGRGGGCRPGRGAVEVALGTGLLLLSVLLDLPRARPLVLGRDRVAARADRERRRADLARVRPTALAGPASAAPHRAAWPGARRAARPAQGRPSAWRGLRGARPPRRTAAAAAISRTGVGIALVIAAGFAFLQATDALSAARDVILAVIAVVVVLGVIFAPWIVRLVRSLTEERAQRIRSQERAEMAAHLHDSVLQTLALVQRRADDPQRGGRARPPPGARAARLARGPAGARPGGAARAGARGSGRRGRGAPRRARSRWWWSATATSTRAVEAVVARGARGDDQRRQVRRRLDGGRLRRVHADRRLQVFVRDRGPGFDPAAVPRRPPRRARVDRRPDGAPRRAGADHERARRRHGGGAAAGGADELAARPDRRRPRAVPLRRARRARAAARDRGRGRHASTRRWRRSPGTARTWCCSTSTCPTAAASR